MKCIFLNLNFFSFSFGLIIFSKEYKGNTSKICGGNRKEKKIHQTRTSGRAHKNTHIKLLRKKNSKLSFKSIATILVNYYYRSRNVERKKKNIYKAHGANLMGLLKVKD